MFLMEFNVDEKIYELIVPVKTVILWKIKGFQFEYILKYDLSLRC